MGNIEVLLADRSACTGCGLCYVVCLEKAIKMVEDSYTHFLYPEIDDTICIKCKKCTNNCPVLARKSDTHQAIYVYAANNKNRRVRMNSASGGLFGALSGKIIDNGGAVAGVRYEGVDKCSHVVVTNKNELEKLYGTKYFQSNLYNCYKEIKNAFSNVDGQILFCGTPCQVDAVRKFVANEGKEDRFIGVDILCRGIPNSFVQKKYIEHLEKKYGHRIESFQMKEKTRGWNNIGIMVGFDNGDTVYEYGLLSAYGKAFMINNLSIRESCFNCQYKTIHRSSDITIGDFWEYRNSHLLDNLGTSFVMVNTKRGNELFESIKGQLDMEESTMWRVYRGNRPAFEKVVCDIGKRKAFWTGLNDGKDIEELLDDIYKNDHVE